MPRNSLKNRVDATLVVYEAMDGGAFFNAPHTLKMQMGPTPMVAQNN